MSSQAPEKVCQKCQAKLGSEEHICPFDGSALQDSGEQPVSGTVVVDYTSPAPEDEEAIIGTVFAGKYEIESVLGRGGMSVVYKARHVFMNRDVAVKVLHTHLMKDNTAVERFKQEAQAASSLDNPNIITVHDFGLSPDGQAFLVMECFNGPTLDKVVETQGRISPARALKIMRQICRGLHHAHSRGVIHRDLKPSNVCVAPAESGEDIVKIVDFGIAKLLHQAGKQRPQHLTRTGQIFGSPLFMSPEQCQAKTLDARSDLYSLGCLMYECLTGLPPLMGETAFDTMTMHVSEKPKALRQVAPDIEVPPELETPVMQCLEKDPDNRPASALALLEDLPPEDFVPQGPWVPRWYNSLRHNQPAKFAVAMLAIVACLLLPLGIFYFKWPGPETDRGTLHERTMWALYMWMAERDLEWKRYQEAMICLHKAKEIAGKFGDAHARLIGTLNVMSRLGADAGDFNYEEVANKELIDVLNERARYAASVEQSELSRLQKMAADHWQVPAAIQAAEARVKRIEYAARELMARQLYDEALKLLDHALRVDTLLLKSDRGHTHDKLHCRIAELYSLEAECKILLQSPAEAVRPNLVESWEIFRTHRGDESPDTIRALLKLGQYDRDQSMFAQAKQELEQALANVKKTDMKLPYLRDECEKSYAEYLKQLSRVSTNSKNKKSKPIAVLPGAAAECPLSPSSLSPK